jgi:hypothetical protein
MSDGALVPQAPRDRNELAEKLGIIPGLPTVVSKDGLKSALGRAGKTFRERYGEEIFQNELGTKIRQDLVGAYLGGSLTIVDKGLLVIAEGGKGGLSIQIGFAGEPMVIGIVEGNSGLLAGLGLHLLPGEK